MVVSWICILYYQMCVLNNRVIISSFQLTITSSNSYHRSNSCWPCYRLGRRPWPWTHWVQGKCIFSQFAGSTMTQNLTVLEKSRRCCWRWFSALKYKLGSFPRNFGCHCSGCFLIPRHGAGCHVSWDMSVPFIVLTGTISAASETESPRRNITKAVHRVFYRIVIFYVRHSLNHMFTRQLMMYHRFLVLLL